MRSLLKNPLFWITFLSFLFSLLFVILWGHISKLTFQDLGQRALYASIFFLVIIVVQLAYLFFTKAEEREKRRLRREQKAKERKKARELKKIKKSAVKKLKQTFYKALNIIKTNHMYKNRTKHNYELPWYLILGGTDSEHRAILDNSNLDFPVNIEYKGEMEESTKNYFKWFFSDDSVFVSVPQQYVTIEKNSSSDAVWQEFLKLFKKERWRRPINGIIVSIDANEILNDGVLDTNEFAKVIKEKLHEISQAFFSKIPVYVIVTNTGNIKGFRTFFAALTSEERKEILGVTFSDNIDEYSDDLVENHMSNLVQKLESEALASMHSSWDTKERKETFLFLDEFQIFLGKISTFTTRIFANTRYTTPLMLRGVYFSDVSSNNIAKFQQASARLPSKLLKQGNGFFLPKVFERIILSDTQLASVNNIYRKRFSYFWLALFGLLGLLFALVIYYWVQSVKTENNEINRIKDIYMQYNGFKQEDLTPEIKLERETSKPESIIKIGKLGGENGKDLNFKPSQTKLTPYAKKQLKKISDRILTFDINTKIKIVGHTDSIGSYRKNLKLSQKRAEAVRRFFAEQGISNERMESIGEGEKRPIAKNTTAYGRSLNRRVEVFAYGLKNQTSEKSYEERYVIDDNLSKSQRALAMLDALSSMIRDENTSNQFWKPGYLSIATRNDTIVKLYEDSLQSLLLPRVSTIIEKELLSNLSDESATQENLKAYLMLEDADHRENGYLEDYMLDRWGTELEDSEIDRLNEHFAALLKTNYDAPSLNKRAIFKARRKLTVHAGKAGLIYQNLKQLAEAKIPNDFQFLEVLDAFPNALMGTEYRIPGFYTKEGYEKIILINAKSFIKEAMSKNWILGDTPQKVKSKELDRVYKKILSLYFSDYRRHWDKALSSISITSYSTPKELSEQLELLSSGSSPIIEILGELKKHTYLLTPKEKAEKLLKKKSETGVTASDVLGGTGAKLDRLQKIGTKIGAEFSGDKYIFSLRENFKPYNQLIGEKGAPSRKLQMVLRHTEKAYQSLMDVDTALNTKEMAFKIINESKGEGKNSTFSIKSTLLPPHILRWYNSALVDSKQYIASLAQGHMVQTYNDGIWAFYKNKIFGKFPVDPESETDIRTEDFEEFFTKGGMLDAFYDQYIMPFVEINADNNTYKIKSNNNENISITKGMVDSMLAAKKIQKLFFKSEGKILELEFEIESKSLSKSLSAMDIIYEKQDIIYEHGPKEAVTFKWPTKYPDSLAKYTLYDLKSKRVVKIRGEGAWALIRLFQKLEKEIISQDRMVVSYDKDDYSGAFEIRSNAVVLFTPQNPFKGFTLEKR